MPEPSHIESSLEVDEKDPLGFLVVEVMKTLEPICRAADNPAAFDGNRAADALGAAAAMIFAGIPEPFRDAEVERWVRFVREASVRIQAGSYHTIKVGTRA